MIPRLLPLAAALSFVTQARAADADVDGGAPTRQRASKQDVHVAAGPGYAHDAVLGDVVAQSLVVGYRYRWFEPAIVGDFGTPVRGGGYAALGMSLGAVLQTDGGARFGLRGVIGSDSYAGLGCETFCSRGAAATLPYAAAHMSASYVFPSTGRLHLELGVDTFYGHDLARARVAYVTNGGPLGPTALTEERTLGGQRLGVTATVGLTFDTSSSAARLLARR